MLKLKSAESNKDVILDVLKRLLPKDRKIKVLEIASGSGQHVTHFAKHIPNSHWQPTDITPSYLKSIEEYISSCGLASRIKPPVVLDVTSPMSDWPTSISTPNIWDTVLCINMLHVAPFSAVQGLFKTASSTLKNETGMLITYGPYANNGVLTPESNVSFHNDLVKENSDWGIRDLSDLCQIAESYNMRLSESIEMPSNNKMLMFSRL